MFTGLIEEIGRITNIAVINGGRRLTIECRKILESIAVDQSVSVSGVCLPVVGLSHNSVVVEAVGETLLKTTISNLCVHDHVNLERALQLGERLGGHLVQGHVNGIGIILKKERRGENWYVEVKVPENLERYLIPEGSLAVEGISFTIASLHGNRVGISVIPHTYSHTTIKESLIGEKVNIEVDFLARHLEKLHQTEVSSAITFKKLKNMGF